MNFNYNSNVSDDEDDNDVNYVLFLSSKKCKYSKKVLELMRKKQFKKEIQEKLANQTFQIFDIIDLYKGSQAIPSYIKSVPMFITSDPVTNEVMDMQTDGNEVYKWILSNTSRSSYTTGTSYGGKMNYSCRSGGLSFNPSGKGGEDGDASQFSEPIEPKGNKNIKNSLDNYSKEYGEMSSKLGLHHQERFSSETNSNDPPPKRTGVGGSGSGSRSDGFASVVGKKKKSGGRIGAYNS